MASEIPTFATFGPPPIVPFDWNNLYHRTSMASCLVQGVYSRERERQQNRVGLDSANDWWDSFGFTLNKPLIDQEDDSIYGAVFKKGDNHQNTPNSAVAPEYVIAFRGTLKKWKTAICDIQNDIRIVNENLDRRKRFRQMIQEIKNYVKIHGNTAVCIAGHSLGAGLALLAGKIMAKSGKPVEAYMFNPPSSLIPLEQLFKHHENLKFKVRVTRDFFKAGVTVATALVQLKVTDFHSFKQLASWRPHLFVNRSDIICSEYIGHFQYKAQMSELRLGWMERLAAGCSIRRMFFGGGEISSSNSSSPQHLHFLPSAVMIQNMIEPPDFSTSHGINQWWNPELQQQSTYTLYS